MTHNRICTYPNCNCTDSPHGVCIAREKDCPESPEPSAAEWREQAEKAERERDEARKDKMWWKEEAAKQESQRDDALRALRALIARAVEAIKPFSALTPSDAERPDNTVVLSPVYLRDLRCLATLAADLRKAGEGV